MSDSLHSCPLCGDAKMISLWHCADVPTHTVVLHQTEKSARDTLRGELDVRQCSYCGFVFNAAFDEGRIHYRENYESTQSFSAVFNVFHSALAAKITKGTAQLAGAIVEVGCGQGEFLAALRGTCDRPLIGIDPAFDPARSAIQDLSATSIQPMPMSAATIDTQVAAIVCKMTLEHIGAPIEFLRQIHDLATASGCTRLYLQVPNAQACFEAGAFWDLYYEHCNYFTDATLFAAFEASGWRVTKREIVFDGQYLFFEATPMKIRDVLGTSVPQCIPQHMSHKIAAVNKYLANAGSVALWGGGSKAVSFVSFVANLENLDCAIDINPRKRGTFLPGSGLPVVSPNDVNTRSIEQIVLLNPTYFEEVTTECERLGISAPITAITDIE